MANTYVNFITDEHLLECIKTLHESYVKAKEHVSKKKFYNNKIDTFKLTFDAQFNGISEKRVIETEILRQIDKTINNSIGTFHEQILGGIEGYERGNLSGYDIKAKDDSLFAIFGSKEISNNIIEGVFEKLSNTSKLYPSATRYFVLIDDFSDTYEKLEIKRG